LARFKTQLSLKRTRKQHFYSGFPVRLLQVTVTITKSKLMFTAATNASYGCERFKPFEENFLPIV